MKLWILLGLTLFIFSGCSTKTQNHRLRTMNAKQANIIRQQNAELDALRVKLKKQLTLKKSIQSRALKSRNLPYSKIPKAPKKNITLKKVEDSNYSSAYMYPGAKKPKKIQTLPKANPKKIENTLSTVSSTGMTKAECIAMIGQKKFDKYTQMFGNESASLKRCRMLKAMK